MEPIFAANSPNTASPLDGFIQQRESILKEKLNVSAQQIRERGEIRRNQLESLLEHEAKIETTLLQAEHAGVYGLNLQRDLYHQLFQLEQERRRVDADCWRDMALVMRDFLAAWEADQQAKARWRLLRD